jgi:hypothetical protein
MGENARRATVEALTSAIFFDPVSVDAIARYLVMMLCDPRSEALALMDVTARAILCEPLSMRLVGAFVKDLATPNSGTLTPLVHVELFAGAALAVPLNYAVECGLETLVRAVRDMLSAPESEPYYTQRTVARANTLVFVDGCAARHEIAQRAWPMLLLTLCYRHYLAFLARLVRERGLDDAFARSLVRGSHECVSALLADPKYASWGRLETLTIVPRTVLLTQLAQLEAALNVDDIGRCERELCALAARFAASCATV